MNSVQLPKLLAVLLVLVTGLFAHTNSGIQGVVTDARTGEELPGANIILEGTVLGASSRLNGSFEISQLDAGTYTLTVSLLGYATVQKQISIDANETITANIQLSESPIDIGMILIESERAYSAASSSTVRQFDIRTRPTNSTQDMLSMAPGVVIAQHAGGGKAEQIFIRGFDADHGTDVNISVDGVPTNMVSHGHGQGYADLHYLIPDVVEAVDVYKGPYFARFGNLATAGAIQFRTKEHIEKNSLRVEGGDFNTSRVTALMQIPSGGEHQNAYLAGQFYRTDGPVETPQKFDRFNFFGKFHTHLSANSKIALSGIAFSSGWDASGQIPQRAVDQGLIGRFGTIDDLEGGTTSRQDLNLTYTLHGDHNSEFTIQSFATRYDFKLFSNFTFFLDNPEQGDMIEQTDQRQFYGLNSTYKFSQNVAGRVFVSTVGSGYRADDITVSLWQSPDRQRQTVLVDSDIFERNFFLWGQQEILFSPRFRIQLGLRGDFFTYNVEDRLDLPSINSSLPHASGYAKQGIISPKFNAVFSPTSNLDLFMNAGSGFHSNDARNVVISQRISQLVRLYRRAGLSQSSIDDTLSAQNFDVNQLDVETLPRAIGAEVGFRTRIMERINVSAAAWWLDLDREYVYIGDAGTTELSDPTRRFGVDLEARARLAGWLWADMDVNLSEGRIRNAETGQDNIPLAPTVTSTGGLTVLHPAGLEGSLRYRHIGDRPANEDGSVTAIGYTVADIALSYTLGYVKLSGQVYNLFDIEWNEAQFDTESRLQNEALPTSEIHFTPGNPRNFRVGLSFKF